MATICFVSYEIAPTTMGGCGVFVRRALEVLLGEGHEVVLLLDLPRHEFGRFLADERPRLPAPERCRAYLVEDLDEGGEPRAIEPRCLYLDRALRFDRALRTLCAQERPDVVEFFDYCGPAYATLARRLAAPGGDGPSLAIRLHGTMEVLRHDGGDCRIEHDHDVLFGLERRSLALADVLLTPSRTYADAHYVERYGLDPGRLIVSPPPKRPLPATTPGEDPRPSIAFIGRLCHVKGADQFVCATSRLLARRPDLPHRVEMLGYDGDLGPGGLPYPDFLRSLASPALLERLDLPGQQPAEAVAACLARAAFAVFPNRVESFCYALHEAYDAGVPVIVNDLPAFRDFFADGRNAVVYDGTTDGLVHAMERLLDDDALARRVRRPYPVGEQGLGGAYRSVHETAPRVHAPAAPAVTVVVLDARDESVPAVRTLAAQETPAAAITCLSSAAPEAGGETFWWLGRPWHAWDCEKGVRGPHELGTTEALLVLDREDRLDPDWLAQAVRILARRSDLGFAGSWWRSGGGAVSSLLDVAPERFPFAFGAERARVLVRTEPGRPLGEVFDSGVGAFGEVAWIWSAIDRWGPGCLWPEPSLAVTPAPAAVDVEALKTLMLRHAHCLGERRSMQLAAMVDQLRLLADADETLELLPPAGPDAIEARRLRAARRLGGRRLLRLAWERARGRWWPGGMRG